MYKDGKIDFVVNKDGLQTFSTNASELNLPSLQRYGVQCCGFMKPALIHFDVSSQEQYLHLLCTGKVQQMLETYYVFYSVRPHLSCNLVE